MKQWIFDMTKIEQMQEEKKRHYKNHWLDEF